MCYRDIYVSAIKLHIRSIQTPSKVHSSVTRALQRQCYPGIAIVDKDSSHSQFIKPWFPCMSMATVEHEKDCTIYNNNNNNINYAHRFFLPNDCD